MSTATGRGRLFFQAVGDPTGPSQLAPKTQNPHIESSLTKNLGLASLQFLDILYPWIGSIKGHYRLVRPGRRGTCGTLVIFQAVGDSTGPSELAPKTLNSHIESSLTKNLGIASSQFLDILYPWIGSIRGHYRLVRPGRRGSCGTLVIHKRNQQTECPIG